MRRIILICFGTSPSALNALQKIRHAHPDASCVLLTRSVLAEEARSTFKADSIVYIEHVLGLLSRILKWILWVRTLDFDEVIILYRPGNFLVLKKSVFASHIKWGLTEWLPKGYLGEGALIRRAIAFPIIASVLFISITKWYLRRWITLKKLQRD